MNVMDKADQQRIEDELVAECRTLYQNSVFHDITFTAGMQRFQAYKVVLGARCAHFRELFFGPNSDSSNQSTFDVDGDPKAFQLFLQYIFADARGARKKEEEEEIAAIVQFATFYWKCRIRPSLWEMTTTIRCCRALALMKTMVRQFLSK